MPIRVLIAADVEVIREAIRNLLACEPTIEVCGEARSFSQTLDLATSLKPDVILLDLYMPDGESPESGFVKLRLLSTRSRILAMALWHEDEETQIIAQGYGAVELLDKGKLFNELIPAIQRVNCERPKPDSRVTRQLRTGTRFTDNRANQDLKGPAYQHAVEPGYASFMDRMKWLETAIAWIGYVLIFGGLIIILILSLRRP
jgi:DNA-binding NarL/FixJ family response regulator